MASTELRAAAQQALEAMRCAVPTGKITLYAWDKAMAALRTALAEPVQEPATLPGPGLVMCPACCAQFDPALNSVQPVQEPVQEPDSPERRCGGPGCDMKCCQPVQEPKPVAWLYRGNLHPFDPSDWASDPATPLYAHPPQRPAKPQGCDHCNHPLYAATKCRVCGRVTEPVQEPVLGIGGKE